MGVGKEEWFGGRDESRTEWCEEREDLCNTAAFVFDICVT